jgi:hypothetical protein
MDEHNRSDRRHDGSIDQEKLKIRADEERKLIRERGSVITL